ncbi:non-structural maintenance of chromosome element, putative [Entamoeba invadens IP1]|uniref:Non-structural maintenance of chromosomes element 4 n=1 Tax=Entamoeba invadens IP1 TaxID=370355 RepID=A0A0A1UDQ2_ENTIV|nr:non-structural maintenance of chromosome element, putative [Entamoeba invadens IP1]ELP94471.1 non-structural maintenance of chromosome element, putative [Entamoeba invadens IP1]|eukprot:XP_004261242.1 non-structural maintenance of chromosome element, putative [Entamoeba invadens IP1]
MSEEQPSSASAESRSKVRKEIRSLLQEVQENRDKLADPDNDDILNIVQRSTQVFSQIDHPREAALDAECFTMTSNVTLEKTQRLKTGFRTYEISSFITKFRELYSESNEISSDQLFKFGTDLLQSGWRVAPYYPIIEGSVVEKQKKERKKIEKIDIGEAVKPKTMNADDWSAAKETPERIKTIKQLLMKAREAPFFEFVLNTESFGQTVENIFYSSFLIKEGSATLKNKKGIPFIAIAELKGKAKDSATSQTVCTLDFGMWKSLVEAVGDHFVQTIPTRETSADALKAIQQYQTQSFYNEEIVTQSGKRTVKPKKVRKTHD